MKRPSRRGFLAGSAVTAVGFACMTGGSYAQQLERLDIDVPDGASSALALVPSESAADTDFRMVILADVTDVDDEDEYGYEVRDVLRSFDDLEVGDVSHVAAGHSMDPYGRLGVAAGSFDQPTPGEVTDEEDDWRLAEASNRAYATADDRAAVAHGEEAATLRNATVDVAAGDAESFLAGRENAATAFELLADKSLVYFAPSVEQMGFTGIGSETLDAFAAGFAADPNLIEGAVENRYVLFPAADADLDDEAVEEIVTELETGIVVEIDIDREDDLVRATVVAEAPPERDREAAPDAQIVAEVDHDEGVVSFRHRGGEAIDTDDLELWHDGELSDDGPADAFDVFEEGDELTVATDPLATVTLRWFDEDANAFYTYASYLVGRDSFEVDHEFDDERLALEYVGEREADPSKLTLQSYSGVDVETLDGFADEYDTLTAGDAITVDGVGVDDRVTLELDVPNEPRQSPTQLVSYRVRPPRIFLHRYRERGVVAQYHDEHERDAGAFRLLVDDQEAETQFEDLTDTLDQGDDVELGDYDIGTTLTVEWTEPDEPMEIGDLVVRPDVRVDMEYDGDSGELTVSHDDGEAVDADDLELRVGGDSTAVQPADEYDRFEPGDELTVEAEPFVEVDLSWTTADVDREYTLGRTVTAADSFEAAYDADTAEVELAYTGEQQADPEGLGVQRYAPSSGATTTSEPQPLFAEEYDALTTGDAVVLEDVEVDERISIVLSSDDGSYRRHAFQFTPKPRFAFSFESREGDIVAVYRDEVARSADAFRVLADGDATDVQPADEYDELEGGDEIDLGTFETGTELIVEWTVPDDPVEVSDHVIAPDAAFDVAFDEDKVLTVTHEGGDELAAADVQLYAQPARTDPVVWDDDGTVEEGDSRTVELEDEPRFVMIVFREREVLHEEQFDG
ncbi:hypothetical protein [Natronorubrum sp. DTA28]|uniref:hypothetical protein n=1 Tax=Natronorubrum sp. DTA28 TaxID=3447019 RepID=UPI003F86CE76